MEFVYVALPQRPGERHGRCAWMRGECVTWLQACASHRGTVRDRMIVTCALRRDTNGLKSNPGCIPPTLQLVAAAALCRLSSNCCEHVNLNWRYRWPGHRRFFHQSLHELYRWVTNRRKGSEVVPNPNTFRHVYSLHVEEARSLAPLWRATVPLYA